MKKLLLLAVVAGLLLGGTVQAAVSFGTAKDGSTLSWETLINQHRDHPEVYTEVTVIDATSASLRGIYNGGDSGDSAMYTALSVAAGDVISFDWSLSNEGNNIPDFNGGNWVGDSTFQFKTDAAQGSFPVATARFISGRDHHTYTLDDGGNWMDNIADLNTGLHIEYVMGETGYTLTATSLADALNTNTVTLDYVDGVSVSDIQSFRVGIWDSEQTVTVSNFTVVPEPATMMLLGLGGLFMARKRR